jgi:hypothetical protein
MAPSVLLNLCSTFSVAASTLVTSRVTVKTVRSALNLVVQILARGAKLLFMASLSLSSGWCPFAEFLKTMT